MKAQKLKFSGKSPLDNALEYRLYKLTGEDWWIINDRTGEIVCVDNARVREWLNRRLLG